VGKPHKEVEKPHKEVGRPHEEAEKPHRAEGAKGMRAKKKNSVSILIALRFINFHVTIASIEKKLFKIKTDQMLSKIDNVTRKIMWIIHIIYQLKNKRG
jgi:hypothetical protein